MVEEDDDEDKDEDDENHRTNSAIARLLILIFTFILIFIFILVLIIPVFILVLIFIIVLIGLALPPMILCVTLNPCLDKTLTVPPWRPGDNIRGRSVREVVGGKGNNVARALARLGRDPRPVTFLGGPTGDHCEALLRRLDRLEPIVVRTDSPTREILTVRTESTAIQTAFFDPDPAITATEAEQLLHLVDRALSAGGIDAVTLSGSSPAPATHGLFSDMIALAQARRVPVFLDTYGPALESVRGFWPTAIQLNRREAAIRLRQPSVTDDDVAGLLDDWHRRGVTCGIVTNGPGPVSILFRGRRFRAVPPTVEAVNPIGSGDSLLAGLVDGWLSALEPEPLFRHAVGCAVANAMVWDAGAIEPSEVARWSERIQVEALST
jgi:1-phosphofructokinase family hexose kinase